MQCGGNRLSLKSGWRRGEGRKSGGNMTRVVARGIKGGEWVEDTRGSTTEREREKRRGIYTGGNRPCPGYHCSCQPVRVGFLTPLSPSRLLTLCWYESNANICRGLIVNGTSANFALRLPRKRLGITKTVLIVIRFRGRRKKRRL